VVGTKNFLPWCWGGSAAEKGKKTRGAENVAFLYSEQDGSSGPSIDLVGQKDQFEDEKRKGAYSKMREKNRTKNTFLS